MFIQPFGGLQCERKRGFLLRRTRDSAWMAFPSMHFLLKLGLEEMPPRIARHRLLARKESHVSNNFFNSGCVSMDGDISRRGT